MVTIHIGAQVITVQVIGVVPGAWDLEDITRIPVLDLDMDFRFIPIFMVAGDGIIHTTIIHTEITISDKTLLITREEEMQYLPLGMEADPTLEMQ